MGKLLNYMQYFGSNIVEGVAESLVEAEMSWVEVEMSWVEVDGGGCSWVEVGARFSNTRLFCISAKEIFFKHGSDSLWLPWLPDDR